MAAAAVRGRRPLWVGKRAVDVVGAAALLLALSLPMLVVAIAVRLTSDGPVLFRQARLGRGGRPFTILKFRTMVADAEHSLHREDRYRLYVDNGYKLHPDDDDRHTPIGSFLRRASLDELPQLWNVLRGQMSLVGPRPIVPEEIAEYGPLAFCYLAVTPGMTGLWQVSGRSSVAYPERCDLDLEYYESQSIRADLRILLRTPMAALKGIGAH